MIVVDLKVDGRAHMQPARRREAVPQRKKRISLKVRREVRRIRRLPDVQKLQRVGGNLRLIVEDVEQSYPYRHLTTLDLYQPVGAHHVEVRPRRIAMAAGPFEKIQRRILPV